MQRDLLPTVLLLSAAGLFVMAVALYASGRELPALAILFAAIGDAAIALWWRGRQRR